MLSLEEAVELHKVFLQRHNQAEYKFAAFVLPIKHGEIYLGQRNSGYLQGTYSAIGGKIELREDSPFLGFDLSRESADITHLGFERPSHAAIRELCEELYSLEPDYNMWEACEIVKLGVVLDAQTGSQCFLRTVQVPDLPFHPNSREIRSIARLVDISIEVINPMTRVALLAVRENPALQQYHAQIPAEIPLDYHHILREWLITY